MPVISSLVPLSKRVQAVFPNPIHQDTSSKSGFTLDSSGVAGFFGGDSAVLAMASVNLIPNRRWVGWYNTPGSYEIAKQFGQLANSPFWDALFPGGQHDPAILFELDGKLGPEFIASYSGTTFAQTGHLSYLLARWAKNMIGAPDDQNDRLGTPTSLVIIDLPRVPPASETLTLPSSWMPKRSAFLAFFPIAGSVMACLLCALVADWYCFANIALGVIANGCACFVVGSGKLTFVRPDRTPYTPRGGGILKQDWGVVLLRGTPTQVISVTRGQFVLRFAQESPQPRPFEAEGGQPLNEQGYWTDSLRSGSSKARRRMRVRHASDESGASLQPLQPSTPSRTQGLDPAWKRFTSPSQRVIGYCALLLTVQFFVQLLLIPQGTLFGQLMFIFTLALSWGYNSYLSSLDREDIQTDILVKGVLGLDLDKHCKKYDFRSRTGMVVFACLAMPYEADRPPPDRMKILNALLPNDTRVWVKWKELVKAKLTADPKLPGQPWRFKVEDEDLVGASVDESKLLKTLLKDAELASERYYLKMSTVNQYLAP